MCIRDKLEIRDKQWNLNKNTEYFIHENIFQNAVCNLLSILPMPQCDSQFLPSCRCFPRGVVGDGDGWQWQVGPAGKLAPGAYSEPPQGRPSQPLRRQRQRKYP